MTGSGESCKEATGMKRDVLSTKVRIKIGFWNFKTMFEAERLPQTTAKIRKYEEYILSVSESSGQALEKLKHPQVGQLYILAEKMLNTKKE